MNNMNITVKENMIIVKYVDISDTYCVHAVYERETRNVLYRVRPVVKYNGKRYIVDVILKERSFERVDSLEHALDLLTDRIGNTNINADDKTTIISWPNYRLRFSVCIDQENNDIDIFGMDNYIYKDIESVYVHMDTLDMVNKGKCNALFINSVDFSESYENEITLKEIV